MKPIKVYWWRNTQHPDVRNFGDWLSPLIVELITGRPVEHASPDNCDMIAIGSLVEVMLESTRREPVQLWGTGFIQDGPSCNDNRIQATALRGPLTAARLDHVHNVALGDPGLLCHHLLDRRPPKKYALGIIPHYVDLEHPLITEYRRNGQYPILSPLMQPQDFIHAVAECEVVISSALHGNITADSLGIPNRWMILSELVLGKGYKFQDYLGLFNIQKTSPIDLPLPDLVTHDLIDSIIEGYSRPGLETIQEGLVASFPQL